MANAAWLIGFLLAGIEAQLPVSQDDLGITKLYRREEWGAVPVNNTERLEYPIKRVVIKHTATPLRNSFESCSNSIRAIQQSHLSGKFNDISYNFLICGDGNIYEGRGWGFDNAVGDGSLDISFVGNFETSELSAQMSKALEELLNEGVRRKKLSENFILNSHNQTARTLSPGKHVYGVLKQFKNFSSDPVLDVK